MLINERGFSFLDKYENDEFEIIFLLEYLHSFKGNINIVLGYTENEKEDKEYFILAKSIFRKVQRIEIVYTDGKQIEEILKSSKISIIPPARSGFDGYSYIFTFFNNGNFAQYRLWGDPDENWSAFAQIINIIFKYVKK